MKYDTLRESALARWQEFENPDVARVLVGTGTCGRAAGASRALAAIESALAETGTAAAIVETGCLGLCYAEPLVELQQAGGPRILYGRVTDDGVAELVTRFFKGDFQPERALGVVNGVPVEGIPPLAELPMLAPQVRVVLRNCGVIDPDRIDHYIARDGYQSLARA